MKKGKIVRRFGENIFDSEKYNKVLTRRSYPPGQHGPKGSGRRSEYGEQLMMKQKLRLMYGLRERQFRHAFERALQMSGNTGENLLRLLEARLDNVVHRLRIASTKSQARQLVSHGHFLLNGRRVDVPSILVKSGDTITIRPKSGTSKYFQEGLKKIEIKQIPAWLSWDPAKQEAKVVSAPEIENVQKSVDASLVVEFYSR